MIKSVSRTLCPWSPYLEDIDGSWLDTWIMGSSLMSWIVIICNSWLFFAKFQPSSMIRSVSRIPIHEVHTLETLMDPIWILGGWGHSWHHGLSYYIMLNLYAKSQLSSMIISVSRACILEDHTWRMLKVLDWSLWGWGPSRLFGSSWKTPINSLWKFHENLTLFGWDIWFWKETNPVIWVKNVFFVKILNM